MKKRISQMIVIAIGVWKESIRNKSLFILTCTFYLSLLGSHIIGAASSVNFDRIVQTAGFFLFGMFGILVNLSLGSTLIREIDEKRLYMVLVRPISRSTFLCGKFIGNCFALITVFATSVLLWLFVLLINQIQITVLHLTALIFLLGEWILIASLSLFLSTFTSPLLHGVFLTSIVFAGHFSKDLVLYSVTAANYAIKKIVICIYYILPNFELMNFKTEALYNTPIAIIDITAGIALLFFWSAGFLIGGSIIFSNKKMS